MIDLKNLDIETIRKLLPGVNKATLEKAAQKLLNNSRLQKEFNKHLKNDTFNNNIDELYKQIQEVFDHDNDSEN